MRARHPTSRPCSTRGFDPLVALVLLAGLPTTAGAQPSLILDLAAIGPNTGTVQRVYGSVGSGAFGVPVSGGMDLDGDSLIDSAVAYMTADPLSRTNAGEVNLIFGDGTIGADIDTAIDQERVLRIFGHRSSETAGNEIWIDDVTGDGVGDLLICRQNYSPTASREGAGGLTILAGGAALRTYAQTLQPVDLFSPPPSLTLTTLAGIAAGDRLCVWLRTGDVTGDGVADIVVAADQEDGPGENHRGTVYVVQGGAHLMSGVEHNLANPAATGLNGRLARIIPPPGSAEYHLGGTNQIADLDGNGRSEVLAAATLNRAGASLGAGLPVHGSGGADKGILYILWDDNFTTPWPSTFEIVIGSQPGSLTEITGSSQNNHFGEEILGGLDYDGDGSAELFVGDLLSDGAPESRPASGIGNVFFNAASLKGLVFNMDTPPVGVNYTTILGPVSGAIGADTAAHGDFDNDGFADLAFCSPKANPQGRQNAGVVDILRGRRGGWPALIDTASFPSPDLVQVTQIQGANGLSGSDQGDILCYSAAAGDVNGDGSTDLFVNEMEGNGTSFLAEDVGNLLIIDGYTILPPIFHDGFESGNVSAWTRSEP